MIRPLYRPGYIESLIVKNLVVVTKTSNQPGQNISSKPGWLAVFPF